MVRFEVAQGDVWEGERQITAQHALIKRLQELGYSTRQAECDLQEMEEAQRHLKHHRDILRWSVQQCR
jgi:hypothetical protein